MILKKKPQSINNNQKIIQNSEKSKSKKTMATLRLQKDLIQYKSQQISFVKLSFPNQQTIQSIIVQIIPQQNSIYYNCKVRFKLQFPDNYPMDPPKLQCLDRIYHPNINHKGSVCLPLIRQDFLPTVNLISIICGLIFILSYPNAQDALVPQIGDLMIKDYQMYKKIVQHTVQGMSFNKLEYDRIKINTKIVY